VQANQVRVSLRCRGRPGYRTDTIEQAAEFSWRIDERIREVLEREDLTIQQKREIAETVWVPGTYGIAVEEPINVEI